jgi:hypothetical protein
MDRTQVSLAMAPVPRGRHLGTALVIVALMLAFAAVPVVAADPVVRIPTATLAPAPTPSPTSVSRLAGSTTTRSAPSGMLAPYVIGPSRVLIYRESAMVKQYTNYWCVPATTQSMLNLILGTSDRSYATQKTYYEGTRKNNRYTYATKGNDPQGWAWALRYYSGNQTTYQARSFTNKTASLAAIVESIDRTGDPVGVTVHRGTHAWIVLGYRAEPDPNDASKRIIVGFYVSGPLGSPTDPWPYAYMTTARFREHFTRYHEWQRDVIWEDTWVIISQ